MKCICGVLACVLFAGAARADLDHDIRAVLEHKLLAKAEVGIEIIRLGNTPGESQAIYQYKSTTRRIPASNLKLITTAAAMETLGADFVFSTKLASRGGDVAIIGDGDPTVGDAELLRKSGWGVDTLFKAWAELLQKRGVTQVRDVYVDDSIFDEIFLHANWPPEQQHKSYVAQVGGVNLNRNLIDFYLRTGGRGQLVDFRTEPTTKYVTIGNTCVAGQKNAVWLSRQPGTNDVVLRGEIDASNQEPVAVTVHDPPMYAATVLAETFAANGIRVTGKVQRDRTIRGSGDWAVLAVNTTPLETVLYRANKDSENLYAESLCKRIGAATSGESGSWENGLAAVAKFLESLGVSPDEFTLDDGCGLSKKNAVSPNAIAKVLQHKFHDKDREIFMSSLAVGGVDGTFENRFRDSELRGRVFGKSGYISGVSSLSGYLHGTDGQWYAFSILMNGLPEGTNAVAKQLQERIVKATNGGGVAAGR